MPELPPDVDTVTEKLHLTAAQRLMLAGMRPRPFPGKTTAVAVLRRMLREAGVDYIQHDEPPNAILDMADTRRAGDELFNVRLGAEPPTHMFFAEPPPDLAQLRRTLQEMRGAEMTATQVIEAPTQETKPRRRNKRRTAKPFQAPPADWSGIADELDAELRAILQSSQADTPEREVQRAEASVQELEESIERYKARLRQLQDSLNNAKRAKQQKQAELDRLREQLATQGPGIADERITALGAFIAKLPGVLGVQPSADGGIKVLIRTAIRDDENKLWDMGDFEFTVPASLSSLYGGYWGTLAYEMHITCVRLPRLDYNANFERYLDADWRLHHHSGTVVQRPDGLYRLEGGKFCVGGRGEQICELLAGGNVEQGLSLLIASMNDTQAKQWLKKHGRYIPDAHEADFYRTDEIKKED